MTRRTVRTLALLLLALLVVLPAAGAAYERRAERRVASLHPAIGETIDAGGRALHVRCQGTGRPAVVVEAGSGSWTVDWLAAQERLARRYRVCTYDRPGYGWSEAATRPPTLERITADLDRVVALAGGGESVVLMGHSLGGLYVRAYALERPERVRGLVLVDARHEDAARDLPDDVVARERSMRRVYRVARLLARVGVVRALGPALLPASGLPEAQAEVFWAQATGPRFFATVQAEIDALPAIEARLRDRRHDVPVVAVRHGLPNMFGDHPDAEAAERVWREHQQDVVARAERGALLVAEGAGHNVHIERPERLLEAMETLEALARPSSEHGQRSFAPSYAPANDRARRPYARVGFEATGEVEDDEAVAHPTLLDRP